MWTKIYWSIIHKIYWSIIFEIAKNCRQTKCLRIGTWLNTLQEVPMRKYTANIKTDAIELESTNCCLWAKSGKLFDFFMALELGMVLHFNWLYKHSYNSVSFASWSAKLKIVCKPLRKSLLTTAIEEYLMRCKIFTLYIVMWAYSVSLSYLLLYNKLFQNITA